MFDTYGHFMPSESHGLSVTEGVVSRIQFDSYVHSGNRMLMVQVDAAMNPGNSGGPVVSNGKVVGISMQIREDAQNIGHIVPAPVVTHFLADIGDGSFDGFPELGVVVEGLENEALREHLALATGSRGVLVTAVSRRGSAHGVIKPGDVLLSIDDVPILEDKTAEDVVSNALIWREDGVPNGDRTRVEASQVPEIKG